MMDSTPAVNAVPEQWPSLPLEAWQDTYATLHMWTQIVGKIRLTLAPKVNHWWHCALHLSPVGLTTTPMPHHSKLLEIEFDLNEHKLLIRTSDHVTRSMELGPRSVADFYQELMSTLESLGFPVTIFTKPQEVPNPIPFEKDTEHAAYDPEYANRFWRILSQAAIVFEQFRGRFIGKCSPVNFYWGSFDLAVTRFSGRRAPPRPGADLITREAYSHECISGGFWPGAGFTGPAFYSYTAPAPEGLKNEAINPGSYHDGLSEFVLMYDDVRNSDSPNDRLLQFLQSTYDAGAKLAKWDREALERRGS